MSTDAGVRFWKMEGAGNDFIVMAAADLGGTLPDGAVAALCDRRRGIGADGVLIVGERRDAVIDVVYRNRDGSEAFCGNGARCAAAFAVARAGAPPELVLQTAGRHLTARVRADGEDTAEVDVEMPAPDAPPRRIPLDEGAGELVVVGVPHLVVGVEALGVSRVADADLARVGPAWRRLPALGAAGANVNVVEGRGAVLAMRTWERGVEEETLACGSGAVAAALVRGDLARGTEVHVEVHVASGDRLRVRWEAGVPWLSGPARTACRGRVSPRLWRPR